LLNLVTYLSFLLLLVLFPFLFFALSFVLILSDQLFLLELEVAINLLDALVELLLEHHPLLSDLLFGLSSDQWVLSFVANSSALELAKAWHLARVLGDFLVFVLLLWRHIRPSFFFSFQP
jgi:hypothetical protein